MHNNQRCQRARIAANGHGCARALSTRYSLIVMIDGSDSNAPTALPPSIARVLRYFQSLGREEKMQALVAYSKRLEPVPERFRELDANAFAVPECQTRVDLFPEFQGGKMHYYADLNVRQSPTIDRKSVV